MNETLLKARTFILTHARLLERRLFQVHFEGESPDCICRVVQAYQNEDGGLGHALEPDARCPESQPLFVSIGLSAMEESGCRDAQLAESLCDYLQSVADKDGLVPCFNDTVYRSPAARHWMNPNIPPGINPTAEICGLLHYQGIRHDWLSKATETCCNMILNDPPAEAHDLFCVSRLAEYLPDPATAAKLMDVIASSLPQASYFIADVPVTAYGLTPLHFAPRPDSICRPLFADDQINGHLQELAGQQQADGGWPISWEAPGPASELEWRGRWTLDAVCRLSAYGVISSG
jgi:hypothetical protein